MLNEVSREEEERVHKPVLLEEVCQMFNLVAPLNNQAQKVTHQIIVDATLGAGGHAAEFIKRGAYVFGMDADEKMINIAGKNLRHTVDKLSCPTGNYDQFFNIVNANFTSIDRVLKENNINAIEGVLFDLGISSYHYMFKDKGFSFQDPVAPLDMRLSESQNVTAADLLNALPMGGLVDLFSQVLEKHQAVKISKEIVRLREVKKIEKVGDITNICNRVLYIRRPMRRKGVLSGPTLPFLALRITVNSELDNLKVGLGKAWRLLKNGGALAVISFHSGEDRIIKEYFRSIAKSSGGATVEKPIRPKNQEISDNPRARSAKLRVIYKKS